MPDSNYTDQDIAAILRRAAELQASAERTADLRPGLTLKELEDVAAEAGLDPRFVRQAATERSGSQRSALRKTPNKNNTHIFAERHVAGTMEEDNWEDTVLELRHRFDTDLGAMMIGSTSYGRSITESFGRSREWRHTSLSGVETRIVVRPREEAVDIRLSQRVGLGSPDAEGAMYGLIPAILLGLVGMAWASSVGVGLGVFVLAWVLGFYVVRHLDLSWRAKKHAELEELADTVARFAVVPADAPSEAVGTPSSSEAEKAKELLDLPEADMLTENDEQINPRSRTR